MDKKDLRCASEYMNGREFRQVVRYPDGFQKQVCFVPRVGLWLFRERRSHHYRWSTPLPITKDRALAFLAEAEKQADEHEAKN